VSVRVKICGVTRAKDAEIAAALGAEIIGINFHPASPRYVSVERAREIRDAVAGRCLVAGVFVNATRDYIAERLRGAGLDLVQFHGDEDERELAGWPVKVIRALRLKADSPRDLISSTLDSSTLSGTKADYLLLDTFNPQLYGGTGEARPLDGLKGLDLTRVFISGGLHPGNVAEACALRPYAVDVASGVESAPGVKDPAKLRSFIANAKSSG
jgi:phosphoribosylanthranilate isomerase